MIRRAPATRAPCTALMPTPPTPSTATVSPGRTPARLTAEPNPVATPQETRATAGHGMSGSTLTTEDSASSCRSENAPSCENRATGSPPIRCAMRPSVIIPVSKSFMPVSHRYARPARQLGHDAAGRDERQRDVVAGRHGRDAVADLRHLARALVAADDRVVRQRQVAGPHVLVGMAQPAGPDLDQHLTGPRLVDLDRIDLVVLAGAVEQRCARTDHVR